MRNIWRRALVLLLFGWFLGRLSTELMPMIHICTPETVGRLDDYGLPDNAAAFETLDGLASQAVPLSTDMLENQVDETGAPVCATMYHYDPALLQNINIPNVFSVEEFTKLDLDSAPSYFLTYKRTDGDYVSIQYSPSAMVKAVRINSLLGDKLIEARVDFAD